MNKKYLTMVTQINAAVLKLILNKLSSEQPVHSVINIYSVLDMVAHIQT